MKLKLKYIMTVAPALLLLAGCMHQEDYAPQGRTLTAKLEMGPDTRTSYDSDGKFSWNTGDKIAVFVGSAYETDIEVTPISGSITLTQTGERSRYAVYPSEAADPANTGSPTLKVILPVSYDISDIVSSTASSGDSFAPGPDFSPMPMVAVNDPTHDILYFRHVGGLLRFKWVGMPAGTKTVTVTFDKDITGPYTVNVVDTSHPTITTQDNATNNVLTFLVSEAGLSADTDVFINIPLPCGHYGSVTFAAYDAAPGTSGDQLTPPSASPTTSLTYTDGLDVSLVFERHWGRMLASDGSFNFVLGNLQDITVEYTGGGPELARNFMSYKTDGKDLFPVPFVLEYSEDGSTGWTTTAPSWLSMDANNEYGGATRGITLRADISEQPNQAVDQHAVALKDPSLHPAKGTASNPFDLSTVNVATGQTVASSTANCYVVQAPGYYKFPLVYGNTLYKGSPNQHAYMTQNASGNWRYGDVCVYSSQHDDYQPTGEKSIERYWRDQKTETVHPHSFWYIGAYRDHTDTPIVRGNNTYITVNGVSIYYNSSTLDYHWISSRFSDKTITAKLIWTDSPGLVELQSTAITGTGTNAYINFHVPEETICQGNAMIAVLVDGVIAWSWHIWVTDEDLTDSKVGSNSYEFSPVNIGWCDPKEVQRYDERKVYVRARQTVTGGLTSSVKTILSKAGRYIKIGGHSPYYEWGRKDPFAPAHLVTTITENGTTVVPVEKTYYYDPAYENEPKCISGEWVSIGTAIQHPYVFYTYDGSDPHGWNWTTSWIINLWNSHLNGYGESYSNVGVTKTIYDPSPVGYSIPPRAAWSGFNTSNFEPGITADGDIGRIYNGDLFFPETGYRTSFNGFKFDYGRYWSATVEAICGDYREAYTLQFSPKYSYTLTSGDPNNGIPIRPIKDTSF